MSAKTTTCPTLPEGGIYLGPLGHIMRPLDLPGETLDVFCEKVEFAFAYRRGRFNADQILQTLKLVSPTVSAMFLRPAVTDITVAIERRLPTSRLEVMVQALDKQQELEWSVTRLLATTRVPYLKGSSGDTMVHLIITTTERVCVAPVGAWPGERG